MTRYNTAGFIEDLPDRNQGRHHHGCGAYQGEDGATVIDSLQTKAENCFVLLFFIKIKLTTLYHGNLIFHSWRLLSTEKVVLSPYKY